MRILVAGASGAIGLRLIPLLVTAGHRVTGLIRSPLKAEPLLRAGATPVVVDALDRQALREAVLGTQPEVVVHEMTALANASDLRHFDRAFARTNRLRTEGLDHLCRGARGRREKGRRAELLRMAIRPRRCAGQDRRRSVGFDAASGIRAFASCDPSSRKRCRPSVGL